MVPTERYTPHTETVHLVGRSVLETFEASAFDVMEPTNNRRLKGRRKEDKQRLEKIQQIKQMVKQTFNGARVCIEEQRDREDLDRLAKETMKSIELAIKKLDNESNSFKTSIKHHSLKDLYPNIFTRFAVWMYAKVFMFDTSEIKQRWYHSVLPFKVTYLVSGPDYNLEDVYDYYERINQSGIHYLARLPLPHDEVQVEIVKGDPPDMIHLDLQVSKSNIRFEHSLPTKHHAFATANPNTH